MRAVIIALLLTGCVGQAVEDDTVACQDVIRETTVGVPFSWAVYDDEENYKMTNGCTYTLITHYVLEDGSSFGGYGGGGLPFGYYARQCQWDACGGPLPDRMDYLSNPSENPSR